MWRVIFLWGLFWKKGKRYYIYIQILHSLFWGKTPARCHLIKTFIRQLDMQQNCLTTIRAITCGWRKQSWCSFTTRLVLAKQCLHMAFSEHVMCYITCGSMRKQLSGGWKAQVQPALQSQHQPSLRWYLQGTCLALAIFLLLLLDKDLSFKLKNPISSGTGFFFSLVPCKNFMHISWVVYATQHEYFKAFFFPPWMLGKVLFYLSRKIFLLLLFKSFF